MMVTGKQSSSELSKPVQELLDLAVTGNVNQLYEKLRLLLRNLYVGDKTLREDIEKIYEKADHGKYSSDCAALLRGSLGFYLFTSIADQMVTLENTDKNILEIKKLKNEAKKYLDETDALNFLFKEYNIPSDLVKSPFTLHKSGTTSFILTTSDKRVLKIIKYYHLDNPYIAENTRNYEKDFQDHAITYAPYVYGSGERFIVMDFVEGVSLREYVKKHLGSEKNSKVERISEIVARLCDILKYYASNGMAHLDLSPDNIMVNCDLHNGEIREIKLIDFGPNYLLSQKVGLMPVYAKAQIYIAPELIKSPEKFRNLRQENEKISLDYLLADVYSLGIIIIEMLSENGITIQSIHEELERHRANYPGIGELLDDIIDQDSKARLFNAPKDERENQGVYSYIKDHVNMELEIYKKVYWKKENETDSSHTASRFIQIITAPWETLFNQHREFKAWQSIIKQYPKVGLERLKRARKTMWWSFICQCVNILTLSYTGYLTWKFYNNHTLFDNLPVLLVGFSFSLVAAQYYLNIFSTLSTSGIPGALAKITDISFRVCAIYFGVVIAFCYYFIPEYWPFLSAGACMVIVVNNLLSHRFALAAEKNIKEINYDEKETEEMMDKPDRIPRSMKEFLVEFKQWYTVFFVYACGPLIVGIGLFASWVPDKLRLKDTLIYALVTFACNFIMLAYNCSGLEAKRIRVELERAIAGYMKAIKYNKEVRQESNSDTNESTSGITRAVDPHLGGENKMSPVSELTGDIEMSKQDHRA